MSLLPNRPYTNVFDHPQLGALEIADPPERWEALGFAVENGHIDLGGVRLTLGGPGVGITRWLVAGIPPTGGIDGLRTKVEHPQPPRRAIKHPNGALGVDHVVVSTPDFDRTSAALQTAQLPLRRIRDAGGFRQGFRRLGPAILELVENGSVPTQEPARFWGLVIIVGDLEALGRRIAPHLAQPRSAVQPGRRIATLKSTAGLSPAVAFMTPEPS